MQAVEISCLGTFKFEKSSCQLIFMQMNVWNVFVCANNTLILYMDVILEKNSKDICTVCYV